MRRTTIFLDDRLLRKAKDYARRQGKSFAEVVREAVGAYVTQGTGGRKAGGLPSIAGRFESGRGDTAARVDELLWHEPHA